MNTHYESPVAWLFLTYHYNYTRITWRAGMKNNQNSHSSQPIQTKDKQKPLNNNQVTLANKVSDGDIRNYIMVARQPPSISNHFSRDLNTASLIKPW